MRQVRKLTWALDTGSPARDPGTGSSAEELPVLRGPVEQVPDEAPEEGAERPRNGADEGADELSGDRHVRRLTRRLPREHDERDREQDDLKRREHDQRGSEAECEDGETDDDPVGVHVQE